MIKICCEKNSALVACYNFTNCFVVSFRFDSEIQRAKDELNHERTLKDKINREKEKALTEKYQLEHDLAVSYLGPPPPGVLRFPLYGGKEDLFCFRNWHRFII